MSDFRIDELTRKLEMLKVEFGAMQKEVSEVIGEMHQGLTAMMNSLRMGFQTMDARLNELEKGSNIQDSEQASEPTRTEGKEL